MISSLRWFSTPPAAATAIYTYNNCRVSSIELEPLGKTVKQYWLKFWGWIQSGNVTDVRQHCVMNHKCRSCMSGLRKIGGPATTDFSKKIWALCTTIWRCGLMPLPGHDSGEVWVLLWCDLGSDEFIVIVYQGWLTCFAIHCAWYLWIALSSVQSCSCRSSSIMSPS